MLIVDTVYEQIRDQLARFEPERGGALYGVRGYPCVTHFEYDPAAVTTGASYLPSVQLIGNVQRVESKTGLEFKGIIHSHPAGIARPSGQDEWAASKFFELNPHHSWMAMPIVQELGTDRSHPERFLHWYRVERSRAKPGRPTRARGRPFGVAETQPVAVMVVADDFHVIPLREHVHWLAQRLSHGSSRRFDIGPALQLLQLQGADLVGMVSTADDGTEFMYFASMAYPVAAPLVLHRSGLNTQSLRFDWDGTTDALQSLEQMACALESEWEKSHSTVGLNRLHSPSPGETWPST